MSESVFSDRKTNVTNISEKDLHIPMGLGEWLYGLFGNNELGLLLFIFLIFFLDAMAVPTLPELSIILAFMVDRSLQFGLALLGIAILAEVVGMIILYLMVIKVRVPGRISKIVNRYAGFLVMGDERLILLNRIAPMIPFTGAFVAIMKWDIKKCILYSILGCVLKYGAVLALSGYLYAYFNSDVAQTVTLIMVFAVIGLSFAASMIIKKRKGITHEDR